MRHPSNTFASSAHVRRCFGTCGLLLALLGPQWLAAAPTVQRLGPAPLVVTDIAMAGSLDRSIWVATKGAGLFKLDGDRTESFDIGRGLPSSVVLRVQPTADGNVFAATPDELLLVDPRARTFRALKVDLLGGGISLLKQSPEDGSLLVQVGPGLLDGQDGELWRLRDGSSRLANLSPPSLLRATGATLDRSGKCLYLAGVATTKSAVLPWLGSECRDGGPHQGIPLILDGPVPVGFTGIAAISNSPTPGGVMLVLVTQSGADTSTRRYRLFEAVEGRLKGGCAHAEFKNTVTALALLPKGWAVATDGMGVQMVDCLSAPRPVADPDGVLKHATALALDPQGRLLVGTTRGLYALPVDAGVPVPLLTSPEGDMPSEAIPTDIAVDEFGQPLVLVSSPTDGFVEVRLTDPWKLTRTWRTGPKGLRDDLVYGVGRYLPTRDLLVALPSQGVARVTDQGLDRLDQLALMSKQVIQLVVDAAGGGFWVATGPTPIDPEGGGLQYFTLQGDLKFSVPIADRRLQPSSMWIQGSQLWMGSRAGLLRIAVGGPLSQLSSHRVETVFGNSADGVTAAVGSAIERWDGSRMKPVLFAVPRGVVAPADLGHPVDVAIDNAKRWSILYSSGKVVLLDSAGAFLSVLGTSQGLPATSARLLHVPSTDDIVVGTRQEGLFLLKRGD